MICIGGFIFYPKGDPSSAISKTVNFGLKDIGELATQVGYFTNIQVIKDSRKVGGVSVPFTEKQHIFSYDGEIHAGVDFDKIHVSEDEGSKTIIVTLPHAEILNKFINEKSYRSYDERNNIFNPLNSEDLVESRKILLDEAVKNAKDNGILDKADDNAQKLIEGFLKGTYDLDEYKVKFEFIENTKEEG